MSKVWLITGVSRGLGRSILEAALQDGGKVLASARDTARFGYLASMAGFKTLIDAYVGHEVGDPERIAKLIVALASRTTLPARLLLGSDAWQVVEAEEQARDKTKQGWKPVTPAADFGAASPEWPSE